ncbi:MAG: polysaccharide biosynthesis C-terminal domain-containing protein [Thiotrichales bacterium]
MTVTSSSDDLARQTGMSGKKVVLNNTFLYASASYLEYFIGLIITTVIARSLGAEQYGVYSSFIWLSALGVALVSGGVNTSIQRYVAEVRGRGDGHLVGAVVRFHIRVLLAAIPFALAILWLGVATLDTQTHGLGFWLLVFAVSIAFIPKALNMFYVSVAKGLEAFHLQLYINLIVNPINLMLVILVGVWRGDVAGFVFAYLVVASIYGLVSWWWLRRAIEPVAVVESNQLEDAYRSGIVRSIKFMSLIFILDFIVDKQLEVFVLNYYGLSAEAGLFNAAFVLAISAVSLVPGVFGGLIIPMMARARADGDDVQKEKYREVARYLVLLAAPLVGFGVVFAREIIDLVFGEHYAASATSFQVIVFVSGIAIASWSANSVLLTRDKQQVLLASLAIGAVMDVALAFMLIPGMGITGALIAFAMTKLFLATVNTWYASTLLATRLEWTYYIRVFVLAAFAAVPVYYLFSGAPNAVVVFVGGPFYMIIFVGLFFVSGHARAADKEIFSYVVGRVREARWGFR